MMAVLVWVAWLLLCGLSWSQVEGTEPTPIVLWHGMGDCCCNPLRNIIIYHSSIGFIYQHFAGKDLTLM